MIANDFNYPWRMSLHVFIFIYDLDIKPKNICPGDGVRVQQEFRSAMRDMLDIQLSPKWTFQGTTDFYSLEELKMLYNHRREHMLGKVKLREVMDKVETSDSGTDAAFAFWYNTVDGHVLPDVCFDGLRSAACIFKLRLLCYDMDLATPPGVEKCSAHTYLDKAMFEALLKNQANGLIPQPQLL